MNGSAPDREKIIRRLAAGVSINAANTDVATFINLPAKCRLRKVTIFDASANLGASIATLAAYDTAAGGGLNLVVAVLLNTLTAAALCFDMTTIVTNYSTTGKVFIRNVVADGAARIVSVAIEVEDLTQ